MQAEVPGWTRQLEHTIIVALVMVRIDFVGDSVAHREVEDSVIDECNRPRAATVQVL